MGSNPGRKITGKACSNTCRRMGLNSGRTAPGKTCRRRKKDRQSMADDQLTRRRKKVESCKACWTYDCSTAFRYFAALPFSPVNYFATLSNLESWYKHMHVGPCGALYPLKSTPSILCRTSREAEHLMHSHTAFHPCGCHRISGPR